MASRIRLLNAFILLMFCGVSYARLLSHPSELVSDGNGFHGFSSLLRLRAREETCEQSYGFLPCTTTALGNLFLIIGYGYLMFLAATYLSTGSELLLEILGPGIVGGLFLPILGALPDAMLILVSGLSGSVETAQSQVSVGMGLLAGSTVMLLTIIWGTCILVGKCDLENSIAIDSKDTKGFSFTGSGLTTDVWTSYAGIIMVVSAIPFVVVQLPQILKIRSGKHLVVLISLIVSVSLLIAYCLFQIFQPWVQEMKLAYVKDKHFRTGLLKNLKMRAMGKLYNDDGIPNRDIILKIFHSIDENGDGHLSARELRSLMVGIQLHEINLQEDDAVNKVMIEFDISRDSKISLDEFVNGVENWLTRTKPSPHISTQRHFEDIHLQTKRQLYLLGDQSDEVTEGEENSRWITIRAVLLLLLGTVIAAAFADPLVDAVDNFSAATSIPTFFISFIALPLATNSSEAVSAIIFASRKNKKSASLTFSELYGAVTMNNVLCLSVFLALVYVRGLDWDFSSEVLVILIVCIVMGTFASVRTTFPLWTSLLAFLLYPISLLLVYVLNYVFRWS